MKNLRSLPHDIERAKTFPVIRMNNLYSFHHDIEQLFARGKLAFPFVNRIASVFYSFFSPSNQLSPLTNCL